MYIGDKGRKISDSEATEIMNKNNAIWSKFCSKNRPSREDYATLFDIEFLIKA